MANDREIFGREPALVLAAGLAVVNLVTVLMGLPGPVQDATTTIATAVFGIGLAVTTRPVAPAAITGGVATILTALAAYGIQLQPELVAGINGAVAAVLALVLRQQVAPARARTPQH